MAQKFRPSMLGYCHLKWDNYLQNLGTMFDELFMKTKENFTDVTLVCDEGSLVAHKLVLSACSSYFAKMLRSIECKHPIFILYGIHLDEMKYLLEFIYRGSVDVPEKNVNTLIQIATKFEIKGFEYYNKKVNVVNNYKNLNNSDSIKKRKFSHDESIYETMNNIDNSQIKDNSGMMSSEASDDSKSGVQTRFRGMKRVPVDEIITNDTGNVRQKLKNSVLKDSNEHSRLNSVCHDDEIKKNIIFRHREKDYFSSDEDVTLNKRQRQRSPIRSPDLSNFTPEITINENEQTNVRENKKHVEYPKEHHEEEQNALYACDICNLTFSKHSLLIRHRREHISNPSIERERPYLCKKCDKRFSTHDKLMMHQEIKHFDRADRDYVPPKKIENSLRSGSSPATSSYSKHDETNGDLEPGNSLTREIVESVKQFSHSGDSEMLSNEALEQMRTRRPGRPRTKPIVYKERRPRGRPRKEPNMGTRGYDTSEDNYDLASLPFGDFSYLTSAIAASQYASAEIGEGKHSPMATRVGPPTTYAELIAEKIAENYSNVLPLIPSVVMNEENTSKEKKLSANKSSEIKSIDETQTNRLKDLYNLSPSLVIESRPSTKVTTSTPTTSVKNISSSTKASLTISAVRQSEQTQDKKDDSIVFDESLFKNAIIKSEEEDEEDEELINGNDVSDEKIKSEEIKSEEDSHIENEIDE